MLWYIFKQDNTLNGIISETINIEIDHHFYEADTIAMTIPYTEEYYNSLQIGYFLKRPNEDKAFIIHTLELNEPEKTIIMNGYGLEAVLNQRVMPYPVAYNDTTENIMHNIINANFINPTDPKRKIPNMTAKKNNIQGSIQNVAYLGDNVYTAFCQLSKDNEIGYRINYNPKNNLFEFETYTGTDRTATQNTNIPVIFRHSAGDTRQETFTLSNMNYKNFAYVVSGDQDDPIRGMIGYLNGTNGLTLFETYISVSDVSKSTQDANGNLLSTDQIQALLSQKGLIEFNKYLKTQDFSFVLRDDIPQVFGKDFYIGDKISVVNEVYGVIKHSRITTIKEVIIQEKSQFELTFDE